MAEISKQDIYKDGVPVGFPKRAREVLSFGSLAVFHCHIRLMYFAKVLDKWKCFFYSRHTHAKYVYLAILCDLFGMVSSRDPFQRFVNADLQRKWG